MGRGRLNPLRTWEAEPTQDMGGKTHTGHGRQDPHRTWKVGPIQYMGGKTHTGYGKHNSWLLECLGKTWALAAPTSETRLLLASTNIKETGHNKQQRMISSMWPC